MQRIILFIAIGIGVAASVWYFNLNTEGDPVAVAQKPSVAQTDPGLQTTEVDTVLESEGLIRPEVQPELLGLQELTAEAEDDATEIVEGFRVRKDRECDIKVHYFDDDGDGILDPAIECIPWNPRVPHPYTTYSDEVLADLAYGDAKAAEIFGSRLIQRAGDDGVKLKALGVGYHLRATALGGDLKLITRAAGRAYSRTWSAANGVEKDNIINHFALEEVAARFGKQRTSNTWRRQLDSLDLPADQLNRIEKLVINHMTTIAEIQTIVTGETSFAEIVNAGQVE